MNKVTPAFLIFALCTMLVSARLTVDAQSKPQKIAEKTRLLFLLDGSGSMLEKWGAPNETKLSIARSILARIVDSLRQNSKIDLALRVYGHQFPPGQNNCKDTKLEVPFGSKNHSLIIEKINQIKPKGVTPISYALQQAAADFPVQPGYRNILILITDGIESCGGDPCATSAALQKRGVFLQPYIIGLGMTAEKSLDCAGTFMNADTPGSFYEILNYAIERSFASTTVSVQLLGPNQRRETNINVSFLNAYSGIAQNEFVNYLDKTQMPDSVQVDPLMKYDLMVSTLPPILKTDVNIEQGKHTTVTISVLQGDLVIQQEGGVDRNLQAIVRQSGKSEVLHVQSVNEKVRYLTGVYEVETLSLPRRRYTVDLKADKTFTLIVPSNGTVNFSTISTGYGALYELKNDGSQEWVCSLDNLKSNFSLNLLPGQYKAVFRVKNSPGSKYTAYKTFSVKSGRTHLVEIFK
jgi:Ca-activated chloride channel family protein